MSFYQRYELARLIADGETKTFRAVENATGRSVLFHFFNPEGQPVLAALKSKLGKVPGQPQRPLLELGEFAGSPYAVTEMIEPFTTLRRWVESVAGGTLPAASNVAMPLASPQPSAAGAEKQPVVAEKRPVIAEKAAEKQPGEFTQFFDSPPEPPKPASSGPGEFTRWFDSSPAAPPKPVSQAPAKAVSPAPAKPASQKDEFEKLFEGTPAPSSSVPLSSAPLSSMRPSSPAASSKTDEFEKLFGGNPVPGPFKPATRPNNFKSPFDETLPPTTARPAAPPASAKPNWPVSPQSDEETGQFTRLFGSGPSGEAINIEEEQARAARAGQPEGRPFQAPTEFTRVFGPQAGGSAPPPQTKIPTKVGSASGLFASVEKKKVAAPSKSAGPGEYTRITSRAELEAEQAALDREKAAAQAAPTPMAARRGWMIGLAIGSAVLVIGIIVILVMVLRKH
jgi:hypothetical protein